MGDGIKPISSCLIDKELQENIVQKIINKEITVQEYRCMLEESDRNSRIAANKCIMGLLNL